MRILGKKWKAAVALFLTAALVLSMGGCTKKTVDNEESTQAGSINPLVEENDSATGEPVPGHWVEKNITPEGRQFILKAPEKLADGSLVFFAKDDADVGPLYRYTSTDAGKTWTEEELDWQDKIGGYISSIAFLSGDKYIVNSIVLNSDNEYESMTIWKIENNEATKLELLDGRDTYSLYLLDENTLLASGMTTGNEMKDFNWIIDLTTNTVVKEMTGISEYVGGSITGAAVDQSTEDSPRLYYTDFTENGQLLSVINKNGDVEKNIASLQASGGDGAVDEDGNYYYNYGGTIRRIVKGGSVQEQIMDDDGFVLGLSNNYCTDLSYGDKTLFFCVICNFTDGGGYQLIRYEWSTEPEEEPEVTLRVWSLHDNALIRAAVVLYNTTHPETKVVYEVGMEDENADYDDVIRNLNVRLVSGKGPDILVLDDLDYENYIAKGYLADISDAVDESLLQKNITDPFKTASGEQFVLPTRFSVPVLMGDESDMNKLKTMDDLLAAVLACQPRPGADLTKDSYYEQWSDAERYGLGFCNLEQLVDFSLKASAPALIENGEISHDNLQKVMEFIYKIGTYYQMDRYPEDCTSNSMFASNGETDPVMLEDGGYEYSVTHHAQYGWGEVLTPAFFGEGKRERMNKDIKSKIIVQPGLVENPYKPLTMLSVTATSQVQDEAKEFIASIMSDEIQTMCYNDGNPVLKSALTARIEKHQPYVTELGYTGDMQAFYDSLKTPVVMSGNTGILRGYMLTHAEAMIKGEETLDAAVSGVENDVKLVFEEQK